MMDSGVVVLLGHLIATIGLVILVVHRLDLFHDPALEAFRDGEHPGSHR
jgi:hypothetical protein